MANIQIPNLPAAIALNGSELVEVVQAGVSLRTTTQSIANLGASLLLSGYGSPEGSVAAPIGTLYCRLDGSTNSTLYVKELGDGSVGWSAK